MKLYFLSILLVCVSGCVTPPKMSSWEQMDYLENLLDSGKYHEAFLIGPIEEKDLKNDVEGCLGLANYMFFNHIVQTGQKDWVAIFKDPRIPYARKDELLTMIHESSVKDGNHWGKMDISSYAAQSFEYDNELQYGRVGNLHETIMEYLEHSGITSDKEVQIRQFSKYLDISQAKRREEELSCVLMDARIPLSIKEHLLLLLHRSGNVTP